MKDLDLNDIRRTIDHLEDEKDFKVFVGHLKLILDRAIAAESKLSELESAKTKESAAQRITEQDALDLKRYRWLRDSDNFPMDDIPDDCIWDHLCEKDRSDFDNFIDFMMRNSEDGAGTLLAKLNEHREPVEQVSGGDDPVNLFEIFEAGWNFKQQTDGHCFDGRDVCRITTSDFWPESLKGLGDKGLEFGVSKSDAIVIVKQEVQARLSNLQLSPNKADVPEGWRIVPIEPEYKMRLVAETFKIKYGYGGHDEPLYTQLSEREFERLWSLLLSEAPLPPLKDE